LTQATKKSVDIDSKATKDAETIKQNPYNGKFVIIQLLSSIYTIISKIDYTLLILFLTRAKMKTPLIF
tara:strand:+ start:20458 stop:20661 length:204 start_codon:yes stop_codon:yes gene_type:complete